MGDELLKQILGELKGLRENQVKMQEDISGMKEDITGLKANQEQMQEDIVELKQGQTRLERKLDEVSNKLDDLEVKNAERHIEISSKLDRISDDVEFIKHKEFENEQNIFKLKKKFDIIK